MPETNRSKDPLEDGVFEAGTFLVFANFLVLAWGAYGLFEHVRGGAEAMLVIALLLITFLLTTIFSMLIAGQAQSNYRKAKIQVSIELAILAAVVFFIAIPLPAPLVAAYVIAIVGGTMVGVGKPSTSLRESSDSYYD